jgi:uncharacterized glyoxalase superfamily protein PhnB
MQTRLNRNLNFTDNTRQAMEFYHMVIDKFGVTWLVNISRPRQ